MKAINFNSDFFKSNRNYNRQDAENKLTEKGYSNFEFTGCSYSNGASFYFTLEDGKKIRVSDHNLTGKRAFDYIQISLVNKTTLPNSAKCPKLIAKKEKETADFKARLAEMIANKA